MTETVMCVAARTRVVSSALCRPPFEPTIGCHRQLAVARHQRMDSTQEETHGQEGKECGRSAAVCESAYVLPESEIGLFLELDDPGQHVR